MKISIVIDTSKMNVFRDIRKFIDEVDPVIRKYIPECSIQFNLEHSDKETDK